MKKTCPASGWNPGIVMRIRKSARYFPGRRVRFLEHIDHVLIATPGGRRCTWINIVGKDGGPCVIDPRELEKVRVKVKRGKSK